MKQNTVLELSSGGIVYKKERGIVSWLLIRHAIALHWGFPKGHVGDKIKNEKLDEAAMREVQEEGGIKAAIISDTPITTQYYFTVKKTLHKKTVHYFLMKYVSGSTEDHDTEVSEAVFIPTEQVREMITYPSDKKAFDEALLLFEALGK